MEGNKCEVCKKPAKQICSLCRSVFYCSKDCQKENWKTHKGKCHKYSVQMHPVYGRYMVATRDIAAGEVIFKETPVVIGPKQRSVPLCLGCLKAVDGKLKCSECHFPLCSSSCQTSNYHKLECRILANATPKINIDKADFINPVYECITPLRCLLTKESDPKGWQAICTLQDHVEELLNADVGKRFQRNVVDFLRNYFHYADSSSEDIFRMCGILITNSFELKYNSSLIRGLFPQAAMISHDCTPNSKHSFDKNSNMIVRATVPIKKGNPITLTYTTTTLSTLRRRMQLKSFKFFLCTCRRCSDPRELGSNGGTRLCEKCGGDFLPLDPLDFNSTWICQKCKHSVIGSMIALDDQQLHMEYGSIDKNSSQQLEGFLTRHQHELHPNHMLLVEAKFDLVRLWGNKPDYRYCGMTVAQMEKKMKYCRELLEVADLIDAGLSLMRGTVLFELQASLLALIKMKVSNDTISNAGAQGILKEAMEYLKEASEILKHEPEFEEGGLDAKLNRLSKEIDI